ncbi:hypothetical protein [uncultured Legionella sp.]|uniref:hypothetical protein n=1 Tax=uncultured Legionella sp. TaxID=210934 RepID=UPI002631BBA9|nr:hypothetical protein [uncultured Legionella sp.]
MNQHLGHRFNDSYRDFLERLLYRGIDVSYETIRQWCIKFESHFKSVIKKRASRPSDKWHLDEQQLRIRGAYYLWRAVDDEGYELEHQTSPTTKKPISVGQRYLAWH